MIFDTFMFFNEFEILEARLLELSDVVDTFVIVEADVNHQDRPKPFYLSEAMNDGWGAEWADQIHVVRATGLPNATDAPNAWWREIAQREYITDALAELGAQPGDIVLHGDCDEIPRALFVRNVRPTAFDGRAPVIAFGMRGHFWAIDWLYPHVWNGTVATLYGTLEHLGESKFGNLRNMRNMAPQPTGFDDAGWHLSWLGGPDRAEEKLAAFCHPEVADDIEAAIADELSYYRDGVHVDGEKMMPVDIDSSFPLYVTLGLAPESWYRPR